MATPNEKLAASLELLKERQEELGNVLRSNELSRTHRERLKKAGVLSDVIQGWLIITRPQDKSHDSTFWYTSFWEFCRRYCSERFGSDWCFSSEQSLLLHAESADIPKQVIVWTPKGAGNHTKLPFDTSLYDLKKALPEKGSHHPRPARHSRHREGTRKPRARIRVSTSGGPRCRRRQRIGGTGWKTTTSRGAPRLGPLPADPE